MGNLGDGEGQIWNMGKYLLHFLEEREPGHFWWENSWEILGLENSVLWERICDFIIVFSKANK